MNIEGIVNIALYLGYFLVAVAVVVVIVLPLIKALDQPKTLVRAGIGLAVILGLFFISYAISGGEASEDASAGISKMVGGLLTMMYILVFVAIVTIVYNEVSKFLK